MSKKEIKISVRNLIEFIMRRGSIDSRFIGKSRAAEGTRAHEKLQKKNLREFAGYEKEVYLKYNFKIQELTITVEGRADGIFFEDENTVIEEIKSTNKDLIYIDEDYNELHWAQAKFYGYIFGKNNSKDKICIQLSYYQLSTNEIKTLRRQFSMEELEEFTFYLINEYYKWAKVSLDWKEIRNEAIKKVKFPFKNYRKGQRELAIAVYNTIRKGSELFAQAPTGIGKTISTLFPSIKAINEGFADRIFYLTAKTITRTVVEDAFERLRDKGLMFKTITLTAKEKICFSKGCACNPDQCIYAKDYYDKINTALFDIISNEMSFSREIIEKYANKYGICPFEFSLDLTLWCDCIICDYNYAFDPRVYLKRFFDDLNEEYIFLIDEAHNLVDRGREMFSAEILKSNIMSCKKILKGKVSKLYKILNDINGYMIELRRTGESEENSLYLLKDQPEDIYPMIRMFLKEAEEYLVKSQGTEGYDEVVDLYFKLNSFVNIAEYYDEGYLTYVDCENRDVKLKLFCIYPRNNLATGMKRAKARIIFSATLTPLNYFIDILGGSEESYKMKLPSPFDRSKFNLMFLPISTRYKHREKTLTIIIDYIHSFISRKVGNYMVFCPSYSYMMNIYEGYKNLYGGENIVYQQSEMDEAMRDAFLLNFKEKPKSTLLAFAVIGGVFSEGIDLTKDKLIGAIIIGVGLPQLCFERELMKNYFDDIKGCGYDYSYTFPGMNKVLQASGRVIRTEEDRGAVLLIDDRFLTPKYRYLMPVEWSEFKVINNLEQLEKCLDEFWN